MKIAAMKSLRSWKKVYGFLSLVMLGSAVGPSVAMAVDFYVDSTKTDDTGDGLSAPNAERNISAAIADAIAAGAGSHTIHVAAGDYTNAGFGSGTQTETLPLLVPNGVKILSDAGPGTTSVRSNQNNWLAMFLGSLTNASTGLEGFTLTNNATSGAGAYFAPTGAGQILKGTLTNNVITSTYAPVYIYGYNAGRMQITLDSNTIDSVVGSSGVDIGAFGGSAVTVTMTQNTIDGAVSHGVAVSAATGDVVLSMDEDELINSGSDGLYAYASSNASISGVLSEVTMSANGSNGANLSADYAGASINFTVTNSSIVNNSNNGLKASASTGGARIDASFDGTDIESNSSRGVYLYSYYDGHIDVSFTNGSIDGNSNQGFSAYAYSTDASIDVSVTSATVSNNSSQGFYFYAEDSTSHINVDISNVTIDGNNGDGIYFYADSNCDSTIDVSNSMINNNDGYGVYLDLSDSVLDATLNNVTITNNSDDGIYAQASSDEGVLNLMVNNSVVNNNDDQGIYVYAYYYGIVNASITNSTVNRNSNEGIFVYAYITGAVAKVELENVKVQNNDTDGIQTYNYWDGSRTELTVKNSTVTGNNGDGIILSAYGYMGGAALIEGTEISNNDGYGVYEYSYYANRLDTLRKSTVSGNADTGVYVSGNYYGYNKMIVEHNTISGNLGEGVYAYASDYGVQLLSMEGNTVTGNSDQGVYLSAYSLGGTVGDLGGGTSLFLPGSVGLNTFSGNNSTFEEVGAGSYAGEVYAARNWWAVNTPQVGTEFLDEETADGLFVIPANTTTLQFAVTSPSDSMVTAGEGFTLAAQEGTYFLDNVGHQPLRISVQVGGVEATNVVLSPDGKTLTGVVGTVSGSGNYDVTVTNPAGQTGTLSGGLVAEVAAPAAEVAESVSTARAYPNPVGNDGMTLDMVPEGTIARLYTYTGELVREMMVDASGTLHWDARNGGGEKVASGTYLLLLEANGEKKTLKIGVER